MQTPTVISCGYSPHLLTTQFEMGRKQLLLANARYNSPERKTRGSTGCWLLLTPKMVNLTKQLKQRNAVHSWPPAKETTPWQKNSNRIWIFTEGRFPCATPASKSVALRGYNSYNNKPIAQS